MDYIKLGRNYIALKQRLSVCSSYAFYNFQPLFTKFTHTLLTCQIWPCTMIFYSHLQRNNRKQSAFSYGFCSKSCLLRSTDSLRLISALFKRFLIFSLAVYLYIPFLSSTICNTFSLFFCLSLSLILPLFLSILSFSTLSFLPSLSDPCLSVARKYLCLHTIRNVSLQIY